MNFFSFKKEAKQGVNSTTIVFIILGIVIFIGIVFTFFFSNAIDRFVYSIKTDPVTSSVHSESTVYINDLKYFLDWQSDDSQKHLSSFVDAVKLTIPKTAAINIYDKDSILIWTDLNVLNGDIGKKHETDDVLETIKGGQLVKSVDSDILKEFNSQNLLEIYTPVYISGNNEKIGVVEVYFDTSDIVSFIRRLYVFVWGTILGSLIIIFWLLRYSFGKQNKKIKDYSFNLEQKVSDRTKELQGKIEELERFHELTVDREYKMIELKKELEELKNKINV